MGDPADEARHLADLRRALAGAAPVQDTQIEWYAGEGDIELRRIGHVGMAHEGREAGEPRYPRRVQRLVLG